MTFQAVAMHAPFPHGVCGPVAEHQQALPHLSRRHRDTSQQGRHVLNMQVQTGLLTNVPNKF